MTEVAGGFRTPYDTTPGSSTPSPHVAPGEGRSELYGFAILSALSTVIIAVVGLAAWWMIH